MPKPKPPSLGAVLRFLRFANGWSEQDLARAAGARTGLIGLYEWGRQELSRDKLEELLAVIGVAPEAVDASLQALAVACPSPEGPGSPVDPTPEQRRNIQRAAAVAGQGATEAARERFTRNVRQELAARDRRLAERLWKELQRLPVARRRSVIETEDKYWTWAFAERLCAESERAAAHRADVAMDLAGLALRVGELAPGSDPWLSRLQGYVWGFVANARRVSGDLPGAEEAFLRSDRLWEAGAPADPSVLDASRLLDLKASLRRHQGRYDESLALLDQALATSPSSGAGRLLLKKGFTLEQKGDAEGAIRVMRNAEPLINAKQEPRLLWVLRLNIGVSLCHLARISHQGVGRGDFAPRVSLRGSCAGVRR